MFKKSKMSCCSYFLVYLKKRKIKFLFHSFFSVYRINLNMKYFHFFFKFSVITPILTSIYSSKFENYQLVANISQMARLFKIVILNYIKPS